MRLFVLKTNLIIDHQHWIWDITLCITVVSIKQRKKQTSSYWEVEKMDWKSELFEAMLWFRFSSVNNFSTVYKTVYKKWKQSVSWIPKACPKVTALILIFICYLGNRQNEQKDFRKMIFFFISDYNLILTLTSLWFKLSLEGLWFDRNIWNEW